MHPPKFDYYRAGSVDEAVALIGQHGGHFIAGGHSLIPSMKLRLSDPGVIVDIGRIDSLRGIRKADGHFTIGALTTHASVVAEEDGSFPDALKQAASMIGDPQVRNRGTVGGNVAHADPASDLPTVFMALNAVFRAIGPGGSRSILAEDFFTGFFETALAENEILTGVEVAAEGGGTGSAYTKMFNPACRFALLGACASLTVNMTGECTAASVAIGGMMPKATAVPSVGAALVGKRLTEANIDEAAHAVLNDLDDDVIGDIHASADYRRQMAPVYIGRALTLASHRAGWVARLQQNVRDVARDVLDEIERRLR